MPSLEAPRGAYPPSTVPIKQITISSIHQKVCARNQTAYQPINFFISIIFYIYAVYRYYSSPSLSDQARAQLEKYYGAQHVSDLPGLYRLLKNRLNCLERMNSRGIGDYQKETQELDKAVSFCKEILLAFKENRLDALLQARLEKRDSFYLPGGYFEQDGSFIPCFYHIGQLQEARRDIAVYRFSKDSEPLSLSYSGMEEKDVESFILHCCRQSLQQTGKDLQKAQQAQVFLQAQAVEGGGKNRQGDGACLPEEEPFALAPWELLLNSIQRSTGAESKSFISSEISSLWISEEARVQLVHQIIQDEFALLEAASEGEKGSCKAIREHLERLISEWEEMSGQDATAIRAKLLSEEISVPSSKIIIDEASQPVSQERKDLDAGFYIDLSRWKENLINAFSRAPEEPIQLYSAILTRAEELMEAGDCRKSRSVALMLLNALPCPGTKLHESQFWKQLNGPDGPELLRSLSSLISRATTLVWEGSVRSERKHMSVEELSGFILSRAALVHIIRLRNHITRRKIQAAHEEIMRQNKAKDPNCASESPPSSYIENGYGNWWSWLRTPEQTQRLKAIFEQARINSEEGGLLLFDHCQTNTDEILDLLAHHPHLRLAHDTAQERKIAAALEYLVSVSAYNGASFDLQGTLHENSAIIRLDACVDAPFFREDFETQVQKSSVCSLLDKEQSYFQDWDQAINRWKKTYSYSADSFLLTFMCRMMTDVFEEKGVSWESLWQEIDPLKRKHLPTDLIHLRRHVMMFQYLLHPEIALALHFGNDRLAGKRAMDWWFALEKQAIEDCQGNLAKKNERIRTLAYGQLREKLRNMKGRLTLQATSYVTRPGSYAITLSSVQNPSEQLYYVPWGLDLPKQLALLFPVVPDVMNAASLAGNIPQEWLSEGIGPGGDQSNLLATRKSPEDFIRQKHSSKHATRERFFPSEPSQMQRLINSYENWVFEYLMRTLKISRHERRVDTGDSGIREALILIVAKPEVLIDPRACAYLDLLFAEPFQLQVFIRTHAKYLKEIAERLSHITEEMLNHSQVPAAAFLIRIGEQFRGHIQLYQNRFMGNVNRDPFIKLESQAKEKPDSESLDTALKSLPAYEKHLSELQKYQDRFPDVVMLAEVDFFRRQKQGIVNFFTFFRSQPVTTFVKLLQLKNSLEGSLDHLGTPMFNQQALDWLREDILKGLVEVIQKRDRIDGEKIDSILNELSNNLSDGAWILLNEGPICKKGEVEFDLDRLTVTHGKDGNLRGEDRRQVISRIPQKILDSVEHFERMFPEMPSDISRFSLPNHEGWAYEWGEGRFRIIDRPGAVAELQKKIGETWHCLQKEPKGEGALFAYASSFGLWQAENRSSYCIQTLRGDFTFRLSDRGEVKDLEWKGEKIIQAPREMAREICRLVDPDHVFCSPDQKKIYLVNHDLELELKNGDWIDPKTGDKLIKHQSELPPESRLSKCSSMLGLCSHLLFQRADGSGRLWIISHEIQKARGVKIEKDPLVQQKLSTLEITFDSRGVSETSTAGYLYLAYRAMTKKLASESFFYLQLAIETPMTSAEHLRSYELVRSLIEKYVPIDRQMQVFYLKALYAFSEIDQGKVGFSSFHIEDRKKYFAKRQEIAELYYSYCKETKESEEIDPFTQKERAYYEQILNEALFDLLPKKLKQNYPIHALHVIDPGKLDENFYSYLAVYLEENHLPSIPPAIFNAEEVLKLFVALLQSAAERRLHRENMDFLFQALHHEDPLVLGAAETARRLIIQYILLSERRAESQLAPFDMQAFQKHRKKTSKKIPESAGEWIKTAGPRILKDLATFKRPKGHLIDRHAVEVTKMLKDWVSSLPLSVPAEQGGFLTFEGFKKEEDLQRKELDELNVKETLSELESLSLNIGLEPLEKKVLQGALEACKESRVENISLDNLFKLVEETLSFIPIEQRRSVVLDREIQDLISARREQRIKKPVFRELVLIEDLIPSQHPFHPDRFFDLIDHSREQTLLEDLPSQVREKFARGASLAIEEEYRQIRNGIEQVKERIKKELLYQRALPKEKIPEIKEVLVPALDRTNSDSIHGCCIALKNSLISSIRSSLPNTHSLLVKKFPKEARLYSEEDLLEEALDLYQFGDENLELSIQEQIENFLYYATFLQQLQAAFRSIAILEKADLQESDYQIESYKLCEILGRHLDIKRYAGLRDVGLKRKFLVSEYRLKIILRSSQIATIQKIQENPEGYQSLRMGEGKTFYIMPVIAALLIEKGKLPFVLVPREQKSLNRIGFNQTTQKVFGSKARAFEIDVEQANSPAYLAELYRNLVKASLEGCYFVLTVDQLSSVTNLVEDMKERRHRALRHLQELAEQKGKDLIEFCETLEGKKEGIKIQRIEKCLSYLRRIELLFDSKGEQPEGVEAFFFGDEVDSILHITKENNRAIGDKRPFTPVVTEMAHLLFSSLLEKDSCSRLKNSLLEGTQVTLKREERLELLKQLAQVAIEELKLASFVSDQNAFLSYLTGESEVAPKDLPPWENTEDQQKIAALKHLLSLTLPSLLATEPSLRYQFDERLAYMVVPAQLGKTEEGNRFGEECEFVAVQYLGYLQAAFCQSKNGATKEFFKKTIQEMAFRNQPFYLELLRIYKEKHARNGEAEELAAMVILEPDCAHFRLDLLADVFQQGLMNRYQEQITLPVQSILTNRAKGGVTGTLNAYALPESAVQGLDKSASSRVVEVETFIKMGVLQENGLYEKLTDFDENNPSQIRETLLSDPKCSAIVDEGGYLSRGISIKESILQLQEAAPEKRFLYPDQSENPDTKEISTQLFVKDPGKKEAVQISPEEARKLKGSYVTVFSPEYTRGTDLPILPGTVHYLPARNTNLQDMGQSIWRGRGTGICHRPQIHVPKSCYQEGMRLIDFLETVALQGLEQQLPFNLGAQRFKVKELAVGAIREGLNRFSPHEKEPEHWNPDYPERIYIHIRFDDRLHELFRGYKIKTKTTDLKGDYASSVTKPYKEQIERLYELEASKLMRMKRQLPIAAQEVFFEVAKEGRSEEVLKKNFEGAANKSHEELAILLDEEGRLKEFQSVMKRVKEEVVSEKKDEIIGARFFQVLFEDFFKTSDRLNPKDRMAQAMDQIKERMMSYLAGKIVEQLAERGKSRSREEWKEEIRKNLQQSVSSNTPFSTLMVQSLSKTVEDSLNPLENVAATALGAVNFIGKSLFGKKPLDPIKKRVEQQVSQKDRSDLDGFALAIQKIDPMKEEFISGASMELIFLALDRYSEVHKTLQNTFDKVVKAKESFSKTYATCHAKYLPEKGKSLELTGGTQEQVQEQEQQQQQQQQQQEVKKKPKKIMDSSIDVHKFAHWEAASMNSPSHYPELFIQTSHRSLYLSREAHKLYQIMTSHAGEPIWKCVVNQWGDVFVITKNDYEQVVRKCVSSKSDQHVVIVPLRGEVTNFLWLQGNRKLIEKAKEPLQAAKILLGFESSEK